MNIAHETTQWRRGCEDMIASHVSCGVWGERDESEMLEVLQALIVEWEETFA